MPAAAHLVLGLGNVHERAIEHAAGADLLR
jgi:hypothetical protein